MQDILTREAGMRYINYIIIAIVLTGCELIQADEHPKVINNYEISTIKEVDTNQWESGNYYEASEENGLEVSSTQEVIQLLDSLTSSGVSIRQAWYVEGKSSCATPNRIVLPVVVPTSMVIQVEEETNADSIGVFHPINQLPVLTCPYYVKHLEPIR